MRGGAWSDAAPAPTASRRAGGATFYERQAANRRRIALLVATHAAVSASLGLAMDVLLLGFPSSGPGLPVVTTTAIGLSALMSWFGYYRGDKALLDSLLARPLDPRDEEHRQLANIVREISLAAGIRPPAVYVIPDRAPNAMSIGRDPEHASLAVTSGALVLLDREETQGVVAHEIAHIVSRDTAVMMLVSALFGNLIVLGDWSRRMFFFARFSTLAGLLLAVPTLLLALVGPVLSRILAMGVSREREYLADAKAVELTRNPNGMASALRKIARTSSPLRGATRGTAHFFVVNPLHRLIDERDTRWADLFATHPPLEHRIALLEGRAV